MGRFEYMKSVDPGLTWEEDHNSPPPLSRRFCLLLKEDKMVSGTQEFEDFPDT